MKKTIIGIIVSVIIIGGGFWWWQNFNKQNEVKLAKQQTYNQDNNSKKDIWLGEFEDELKTEKNDWKSYMNKDFGIYFKFKDYENKVTINGNPNYLCLKQFDRNNFDRCYIHITFWKYDKESYNSLEEWIEAENENRNKDQLGGRKLSSSEDIINMQRIKNDNNISLIKVNKFSNDHDYKFVDYYIEYNSLIYGNEDYNKSYILISLDKDKYDFYFNELDKKIQLEQFEQIITTFDLIKNK